MQHGAVVHHACESPFVCLFVDIILVNVVTRMMMRLLCGMGEAAGVVVVQFPSYVLSKHIFFPCNLLKSEELYLTSVTLSGNCGASIQALGLPVFIRGTLGLLYSVTLSCLCFPVTVCCA